MIQITLPDGSKRDYPGPVTVAEVAASIGSGLAKAALAGKVDGKVVDTSFVLDKDSALSIVTAKDADGLEVIRHSMAHLLAYAVKELFPDAQVTIGPVIENGFFYDFSYKRPFTLEDLAAIEKRMAALAAKDESVSRRVLRVTKQLRISRALASITRPRSSPAFRPMKMCPCTVKETSKTCAAARMCRAPASSNSSS